jgi:Sad1 / UNC-like C-terminal
MPRCRRFATAWAIVILIFYASPCSTAPSSASLNTDSTPLPSSNSITEHSSLPRLEDCATWSGFSSGDATEEALHIHMCNRSATTFNIQQQPTSTATTTPDSTTPVDDVESVKAIEEAVLEVLPTAQQNFALTRDGAKVLAHNPGAKKVRAILDDDSDTYMRNECQDDKWVVLELSQVAKVSRIEIIQHELYSSRIKDFEIRGRQSHPRTDNVETSKGLNSTAWKLLGKFTAEKAKGTQQFIVERPLWAHYLLIRFLTHYGTEPVCALNGFAVYGKSAAEELEDQLGEGELGLEIESEVDSGSNLGFSEEEGGGGGGGGGGGAFFENASSDGVVSKGSTKSKPDSEEKKAFEEEQQQQQNMEEGGGRGSVVDGAKAPAAAVPSKEEKLVGRDNKEDIDKKYMKPITGAKVVESSEKPRAEKTDSVAPGHDSSKAASQQLKDAGTSPPTAPSKTADTTPGVDGNSPTTTTTTKTPMPILDHSDEPAAATNITDAPIAAAAAAINLSSPSTSSDAAASVPTGTTTGSPPSATATNNAAGSIDMPLDMFEPLPVPKMKSSGGVYDVLVQEIRVTKAQQRVTAKALESLQRNLTAATTALSRIKTEYEISDADLGKKVDFSISEKLNLYEKEMKELRNALKRAAKREHAALSLLAMLGGALVLTLQSGTGRYLGKRWPKARTAVIVLALLNGAVGVALHWQSAGYHYFGSSAAYNGNDGSNAEYYLGGGSISTAGAPSGSAPSAAASPLP